MTAPRGEGMAAMTTAWGRGLATVTDDGTVLDTWFREVGLGDEPMPEKFEAYTTAERHDDVRRVHIRAVQLTIDTDDKPAGASDAYLRLHLLSHRLMQAAPAEPRRSVRSAGERGLDEPRSDAGGRHRGAAVARAPVGCDPHRARRRQVPAHDRLRGADRRADRRRRPCAPRRTPRRGHHRDARGVLQLQRRHARHEHGRRSHLARRRSSATAATSAAARASWARCPAAATNRSRSANGACSAPRPASASASATNAWWRPVCTSRPARWSPSTVPQGIDVVKAKLLSGKGGLLYRRNSHIRRRRGLPPQRRSGTASTPTSTRTDRYLGPDRPISPPGSFPSRKPGRK